MDAGTRNPGRRLGAIFALTLTALVWAGWAAASAPTQPAAAPSAPALPTPQQVMDAMGNAAEGLRDYTMTLVKQDWSNGTPGRETVFAAKWARPASFYFKILSERQKGQQVLYVEGWNSNKLRVKLGGFPYLRLSLDPFGDLALRDTWHPVPETNLAQFVALVRANHDAGREHGDLAARVLREEAFDGRPCVVVELAAAANPVAEYLIPEGETLWDVARRFQTAAAPILQWNRALRWKHPSDLGPGRRVVVPRYYASRIELWIDRERWLPLNARIYDTDGNLFERFEHRDLKINVGLTPMDFSTENPEYGY